MNPFVKGAALAIFGCVCLGLAIMLNLPTAAWITLFVSSVTFNVWGVTIFIQQLRRMGE